MVKELKIELEGKEYLIKSNNECLLLFEEITGNGTINVEKNLTYAFTMYYCMTKANNVFDFSFKEFVKMIDKNIDTVDDYNAMVDSYNADEKNEVKKVKKIKALDVFNKYYNDDTEVKAKINNDVPEDVKKKKINPLK